MDDVYEVRVRGHLDDRLASWLGDLTVVHNDDGTSTLTAANADQSRLHGLLAGLRDLGAHLVSLRLVEAVPPTTELSETAARADAPSRPRSDGC